jgi:hypothetical protein
MRPSPLAPDERAACGPEGKHPGLIVKRCGYRLWPCRARFPRAATAASAYGGARAHRPCRARPAALRFLSRLATPLGSGAVLARLGDDARRRGARAGLRDPLHGRRRRSRREARAKRIVSRRCHVGRRGAPAKGQDRARDARARVQELRSRPLPSALTARREDAPTQARSRRARARHRGGAGCASRRECAYFLRKRGSVVGRDDRARTLESMRARSEDSSNPSEAAGRSGRSRCSAITSRVSAGSRRSPRI